MIVSKPEPPNPFSIVQLIGDADIAVHSPDRGIAAGEQADGLVCPISRAIQRVVSGAVPDREDRMRILREAIDREPVRRASCDIGGDVEAVGAVAGACREVGAVGRLDRGDVVHHRRRRKIIAEVRSILRPGIRGRVVAAEIGHDGELAIVLRELGTVGVADGTATAGIIRSRMRQSECVADFVHEGRHTIAAVEHVGVLVVACPGAVQPDLLRGGLVVATRKPAEERLGIGAAALSAAGIVDGDVRGGIVKRLVEIDPNRIVPELEPQPRHVLHHVAHDECVGFVITAVGRIPVRDRIADVGAEKGPIRALISAAPLRAKLVDDLAEAEGRPRGHDGCFNPGGRRIEEMCVVAKRAAKLTHSRSPCCGHERAGLFVRRSK